MKILERTVDIDASADAVWRVLSDAASYPEWNPFMTMKAWPKAAGDKLEVTIQPPGRKGLTLKPTVTVLEAGRSLQWLGHLGIRGIFDGAHELTVEPVDATHSRFVQRETFKGILVPVTGKILDATADGFAAMNAALKDRVEAQNPAGR